MRFVPYNTLAEEAHPALKNLLPDHWYLVLDDEVIGSISKLDMMYKPDLLEALFRTAYNNGVRDGALNPLLR